MIEKFKIARRFRISGKSKNPNYAKLFFKCYLAYIYYCIIKGKDEFELHFNGEYFTKPYFRFLDWLNFINDWFYRSYLVLIKKPILRLYSFFSKNQNLQITTREYLFMNYRVTPPVHIKISNCPNEAVLEFYLKKNGFKVKAEFLESVNSHYIICKIPDV